MRIVIDCRMYGLEHAGIGRYVINLVEHLEKIDRKNEYFLFLRKKYFQELKFKNKNFKKILTDYPHYSFQEQVFLPFKLLEIKPDLVHFPHFNQPLLWFGKQVVTIHDLIKHESRGPETTTRWQPFYWFKHLNYRFLVWLAVRKADRIIVPSHYWKKDLVQRFKLSPKKIVVTYEGVDKKFQVLKNKSSAKILSQYKIKKPFIIYTGNLYPHKNVERLVEAVKELRLSLVIVCSRNVFYERFKKRVKEMKAEKWVKLLGFVPDEDLVGLYQEAEAFVWPTLIEGFGLPPLEAMSVGCPVLLSDIPVLREICGQTALYFDPYNVEEIVKKIRGIVGNREMREKLIKKGFKQVEKYSWQKMAQETLEVYENCFSLFRKKQSRRLKE